MPTVDELLADAGVASAAGEVKVNLSTRRIEIPESAGVLGVTSDECVRPVTFRIPRWYFEEDLATFGWSVNYRNAAGETARMLMRVEDVGEGEFSCEWLIPRHACAQDGKVSFALCGILHGEDGASIVREWNTVPAEFTVPLGLESEVTEEELRLDWVWRVVTDCEKATAQALRAADEAAAESARVLGETLASLQDKRLLLQPDEPAPRSEGMTWAETDEGSKTVTAIKRWNPELPGRGLAPRVGLTPRTGLTPRGKGDWEEFKLAPSVLA